MYAAGIALRGALHCQRSFSSYTFPFQNASSRHSAFSTHDLSADWEVSFRGQNQTGRPGLGETTGCDQKQRRRPACVGFGRALWAPLKSKSRKSPSHGLDSVAEMHICEPFMTFMTFCQPFNKSYTQIQPKKCRRSDICAHKSGHKK